jgi:hypothetical protein
MGCGMTRAVLSAIRFDFSSACHYNKLVVIIMPVLTYLWLKTVLKLWNRKKTDRQAVQKQDII